jgi:hypothetical protein
MAALHRGISASDIDVLSLWIISIQRLCVAGDHPGVVVSTGGVSAWRVYCASRVSVGMDAHL